MARKGTLTKTVTLPDGSRKWIYAKNQEELARKLLDYQIQLGMGIDLTNLDTFGEYAQAWYKTYKEPHLREKSKESLLYVLNNHILPRISGYKIRDISPMHIQMVFNSLSGYSASLNSKVKAVLTEIFETAEADNIIMKSPVTRKIVVGGRKTEEKEALTPEQAESLLSALKGSTNNGMKQCYLFCLLALQTGLRRGELCGLMWSDINFQKAELTVTHNCTWPRNVDTVVSNDLKTPAAHRTVPIPMLALQALKKAKSGANSLFVFSKADGQALSYSSFRTLWSHTAKAHLGKDVTLTPHILRHTYCTRLFEAGLDVKEIQYLMGHSTPEMSMRVYTHYSKKSRFEDTSQKVCAAL